MSNPYEEAKRLIRPAFPKEAFRIFVLGPFLKPDSVVAKPTIKPDNHDAVIEHARYLRYATKLALEGEGFKVDFGETQQMLDFWNQHFGAPDPGSAELLQADRISGAVIIYPSSAGSLCELGMFAPQKVIAEKSFAIVHQLYEHDSSFFRNAMLEVFAQQNGRFEFRDYSDHDRCVADAKRFAMGKFQSLLRDFRNIDNAELLKRKYHGTAFQHKS